MAKHPDTAERELPGEAVDVVKAAARIRHKLTKDWYTEGQVGALLGFGGEDAIPHATWLRRQGILLGAWVPSEHAYRFPTWQFAGDAPIPELQPILRLLREHGGVIDGGKRTSGWNEVEWFRTPHVDLDGATPIERLADHAQDVLKAAEAEFLEDPNAAW